MTPFTRLLLEKAKQRALKQKAKVKKPVTKSMKKKSTSPKAKGKDQPLPAAGKNIKLNKDKQSEITNVDGLNKNIIDPTTAKKDNQFNPKRHSQPQHSDEEYENMSESSVSKSMNKFQNLYVTLKEEFAKEIDAQQDLANLIDDEGVAEAGAEDITVTFTREEFDALTKAFEKIKAACPECDDAEIGAEDESADAGSEGELGDAGVTDEDEEDAGKTIGSKNLKGATAPAPVVKDNKGDLFNKPAVEKLKAPTVKAPTEKK